MSDGRGVHGAPEPGRTRVRIQLEREWLWMNVKGLVITVAVAIVVVGCSMAGFWSQGTSSSDGRVGPPTSEAKQRKWHRGY